MTHVGTLHVYAQDHEHHEAYIAGDVETLKALRDAIDVAIHSDDSDDDAVSSILTFTADGEGYDLVIVRRNEKRMDKMALPYTDAEWRDARQREKVWPETIEAVRNHLLEKHKAARAQMREERRRR